MNGGGTFVCLGGRGGGVNDSSAITLDFSRIGKASSFCEIPEIAAARSLCMVRTSSRRYFTATGPFVPSFWSGSDIETRMLSYEGRFRE